jgi:hypothetical protein
MNDAAFSGSPLGFRAMTKKGEIPPICSTVLYSDGDRVLFLRKNDTLTLTTKDEQTGGHHSAPAAALVKVSGWLHHVYSKIGENNVHY